MNHPSTNPYRRLAQRLHALPNGFPPTADGTELRLLEYLFSAEEAALAADLRITLETPAQLAARLEHPDPRALRNLLKGMARRGLIKSGRAEGGMGYGLLPFVVGIYEFQIERIDSEMARRFEDYYQQAFRHVITMEPAVHRVIPVNESVRVDMEIRPYESAVDIVDTAKAWGVVDCICRTQKALIGDPCGHPVDVCMVLSEVPGVFDHSSAVRKLERDEAVDTLRRSAEAGLVHSVSNNQEGLWYICNCCTCSCGVLRGIAELGMADVVARSPFVNTVAAADCIGCENCLDACQFDALKLNVDYVMEVDARRCVGCGVCVLQCDEEAMALVRRPASEITPIPLTEAEWGEARARSRGIDLDAVR